jgi:hypothetical protein
MSKFSKILILSLFSLWTSVNGQQLSHQVLVPAASVIQAGSVSYSQTVGEPVVEIISAAGFELTQGFQQPSVKVTAEETHQGTGVEVYPNPATDHLFVKMFGDGARKYTIDVINMAGVIVNTTKMEFITQYYYILQLDVARLTMGLYFVRVTSGDNLIKRIFKIEKM